MPAAVEGPSPVVVGLQILIYLLSVALGIGAAALWLVRRVDASPYARGARAWFGVLGLWAAGTIVAYRHLPLTQWVGVAEAMLKNAVIGAFVWPAGNMLAVLTWGNDPARARWKVAAAGTAVGALAGLLTWGLFTAVEIRVPEYLEQLDAQLQSSKAGLMLAATQAAMAEELVFRLGFFVLLAFALRSIDPRGVVAAVVSSALWAAAHLPVDPWWVKYAQIFVFGLMQCALLRWTRSLAAPVIAHVTFNAGVVLISWVWPEVV